MRAWKRDGLIWAGRIPANHTPTRIQVIAAEVRTCWRRVFAAPRERTRWTHNSPHRCSACHGSGLAFVFVRGAFSDLRIWEAQRQAVAQQYRFIADNQRYHGTAPWPDERQHYAAATHAADLAAFIRQLNAGPVQLVAH